MKGANRYKLFLAQTYTSNMSVFNLRLRLSSASIVSVSSVRALIAIIELCLVLSDCVAALLVASQPLTNSPNPNKRQQFFYVLISYLSHLSLSRLVRTPIYFFAHLHLRLVGVFSLDSAVYQDIYHTDGKAQLFQFPPPPQFEPNAWLNTKYY
jgi:hypothetical protein